MATFFGIARSAIRDLFKVVLNTCFDPTSDLLIGTPTEFDFGIVGVVNGLGSLQQKIRLLNTVILMKCTVIASFYTEIVTSAYQTTMGHSKNSNFPR